MPSISTWKRRRTQRRRYLSLYRDYYTPCITQGLTFNAPLIYDDRPLHSAAGTTAMSTKTVDSDRWFVDRQTGLLKQATTNVPRITRHGVLSEAPATNLLKQSNQFTTTWVAGTGTPDIVQNSIGPDGIANSAWTITDAEAGSREELKQTIVVVSDTTTRVYSIFVKKTSGATTFPTFFVTYWNGGTQTTGAININTNTGVATPVTGATPATYGVIDYSATYWRVYVSKANNGTGNTNCDVWIQPSGLTSAITAPASYVGSTTVYGAQLEVGSYPTQYIGHTGASSVVGSADALQYPYSGNISLAAGTIHVAFSISSTQSATRYLLEISVTDNDRLAMYIDTNSKLNFLVKAASATSAALVSTSALTPNTMYVGSFIWTTNDVRMYLNAGDAKADTPPAAMPSGTPTYLSVGKYTSGTANNLDGTIQHLAGFNYAQSLAEIQAIVRKDYTRWVPSLSL